MQFVQSVKTAEGRYHEATCHCVWLQQYECLVLSACLLALSAHGRTDPDIVTVRQSEHRTVTHTVTEKHRHKDTDKGHTHTQIHIYLLADHVPLRTAKEEVASCCYIYNMFRSKHDIVISVLDP